MRSLLSATTSSSATPAPLGLPLGLGYVRVPPGAPKGTGLVAEGIAILEAFAHGRGLGLGEVFVDDEPPRRLGWGSLVDAVQVANPVAVLVPDLIGLQVSGAEVEVLRARLRLVTTAPLVLASPAEVSMPPDPALMTTSGGLPAGSETPAGGTGSTAFPFPSWTPVPGSQHASRRSPRRARRGGWWPSWGRTPR